MAVDTPTLVDFCQKYDGKQFYSPRNEVVYTLWRCDQLKELNTSYRVGENVPGYIGIGTSGGGEMLAINTESEKIYSIPFIPMDEKEAVLIAENLEEFVTYLQ